MWTPEGDREVDETDVGTCQFYRGHCELIRQQCGHKVEPQADACRACWETATPATGSFNHVTTSLSLGAVKVHNPEDLEDARRAWGHLLRRAVSVNQFLGGVGSSFKALLATVGFQPCETCNNYARKMDREGPDWCEENEDLILGWIKNNARKRGVPYVRFAVRQVLRLAIKQARDNMIKNLKDAFQEVYCVNLDRRKDRWRDFQERLGRAPGAGWGGQDPIPWEADPDLWPFKTPVRYSAIDGKKVPPPPWWNQGGGAWGCFRSHLRILEDALNRGVESVLFLEDDATLLPDFRTKVETFFRHLPEDWGMVYLGGQHLLIDRHPPRKVTEEVYVPYNVNRTHAFGLRGEMMRVVYKHISRVDWANGHHIDHHLGRLHMNRAHPIYTPKEWIMGQAEGRSNISGRDFEAERFWTAAEDIASVDVDSQPFLAILGLHSSGSSALAGVLYHLGIHMGNKLVGYYGQDPEGKSCGYEAEGLARICEAALPFPSVEYGWKRGKIWSELRTWINQKRREAANQQTLAGGKYPQLSACGDQLRNICGDLLRVIVSDRPLEESVESMVRRTGKPREQVQAHQEKLLRSRQKLVSELKPEQVLTIHYANLLEDPHQEISRICEFLKPDGWEPLDGRIEKAASTIHPDLRHIGAAP